MLELNLTRTVQRRGDLSSAKRNLQKVVFNAAKSEPKCGVPQITIHKTNTGFSAKIAFPGKYNDTHQAALRTTVLEALILRFDPPWLEDTVEIHPLGIGTPVDPAAVIEKADPTRPIGEINLDFPPDAFSRIYGREAQIRRLTDAISLGRDTHWNKRKHTLFLGPPGCGKTETMLTFARHLGEEGKAWLWFDATSTTRAGAIEMLMKSPVVPPVLFVEEIEKTHESSLRWLLGLMDERGEVRRTNYRVGNQVKAINMCVVATCNNEQLLKSMDAGALYSRFANRVFCPEPGRDVLEKILLREIAELVPDMTLWPKHHHWVKETLEFAYDDLAIRDPRELINMVLCGRDRLLDGSYQADFKATLSPMDRKQLA